MSLLAKQNGDGKEFERCPEGNHVAICYMVCDLGMHESNYQGQISNKRKVRMAFELPNELMTDGRPFSVSGEYTLSLDKKSKLRPLLESWRGRPFTDDELKGFDLFNVLGHGCMVNVIHTHKDDKTYVNIASIARLPKGMTTDLPSNEIIKFSLDGGENITSFDSLPNWLKSRINTDLKQDINQDEYDESLASQKFDDDIPF